MMSPKIFSLLQKHQSLDAQLRLEQSRRRPDFSRLSQLKKLKLQVKDALHAVAPGQRAISTR
jgi:uncharacterized protein YdcH (DUF465 family)